MMLTLRQIQLAALCSISLLDILKDNHDILSICVSLSIKGLAVLPDPDVQASVADPQLVRGLADLPQARILGCRGYFSSLCCHAVVTVDLYSSIIKLATAGFSDNLYCKQWGLLHAKSYPTG